MHDLGFLTRDWMNSGSQAVKELRPNHWTAREFPSSGIARGGKKQKKVSEMCYSRETFLLFVILLFENTFTEIQFTYRKIYPFKVYKSMTLVHLEYTNITKTWIQNFFFLFKIFIWLLQVLVAECGIFSCSTWDLVPWPGIEPGPPALGAQSLSHWTTREIPEFRIFLSPAKEKPISPFPNPQVTINLLSISTDLLILDTSYKWNHSIWSFTIVFFHLN